VVRLAAAAAAVLLVASGIGQFTLPVRWQPWSRLTGHMQSLDKEIQSVPRAQTPKTSANTVNAPVPTSKPLVLDADDLPALIPAPAKANTGEVTITEASARSKPSPGKLLFQPGSAPSRANADRVKVANAPSRPASASTVVSPTSPPPAAVKTSKNNVAETASKATAAMGNPVGGTLGSAEPPDKVAGSTGAGNGAQSGMDAKEKSKVAPAGLPAVTGTARAGSSRKVASAGIPDAVTGVIHAKRGVAPVPAEMLPPPISSSNPAEQSTPNCGGTTELPCPTLHVRPTEHQD